MEALPSDTITEAMYGVFTKRDLSWLLSKRPNKQLSESDANIYIQTLDRSCGLIREKLEPAVEEGDPVGGPSISINLDPCDVTDTATPNRQHTPADMRPQIHKVEQCRMQTQSMKVQHPRD